MLSISNQRLLGACPFNLPYAALQTGLLDFLRIRHNYHTVIADYSLADGFGAATNGVTIAICREFTARYPAYALFATAHHAGHGQHIRARDHCRMLELLNLAHENLSLLEKQAVIREIYTQDHDVSCIGLGLLVDAFYAGYLPLASSDELNQLLNEMHAYYLHDISEFIRCLETDALPLLTHAPEQTPRHPLARNLTIQNRQPVLQARKLDTALVFHVGLPGNNILSQQIDLEMRRRADKILDEIGFIT